MSPIKIDHLRPGTGIDVLLTVGINLIHRLVGVPEDHRADFLLFIQELAGLALEIQEKLAGFFLQDLRRHAETRAPPARIYETGLKKVERR